MSSYVTVSIHFDEDTRCAVSLCGPDGWIDIGPLGEDAEPLLCFRVPSAVKRLRDACDDLLILMADQEERLTELANANGPADGVVPDLMAALERSLAHLKAERDARAESTRVIHVHGRGDRVVDIGTQDGAHDRGDG